MQQANRRGRTKRPSLFSAPIGGQRLFGTWRIVPEEWRTVFKTSDGHFAGGWLANQSQSFFPQSPEQLLPLYRSVGLWNVMPCCWSRSSAGSVL